MTRRTPLWSTRDVGVHRFDHAPDDHDHGPVDEIGQQFSASFVESGSFDVEVDGQAWRLVAGDVLLLHPGMRFRVSHPHGDLSDVCLSVSYTAADENRFDRARTWARARRPVLRADHRLRYLHWGLRRALDTDVALLAETCAAELFLEVPLERAPPGRAYRDRTFAFCAERVHAAREHIDRAYAEPLRLDALARSVGMSSFHFARRFAEFVGMPPHRYLLDTRLRAADAMLGDGRSVTETCYACGFNNLSHFSRIFARHYGRSPSLRRSRPS